MAWSKAKTGIAIGVTAILAVGTTTIIIQHRTRGERLPTPRPVAAGETEFPKDSWHFAGYTSPESVLMSCMWAVDKGDTNALLASVSPSEQKRLNEGHEIISETDRESYDQMTGYRIIDKQVLSEDKVVLVVKTSGLEQTANCSVQRIDGEWKFAGRAGK